MILKNRFKEEDKMRVWIDHPYCIFTKEDGTKCNSNYICSIHHILGTSSDSILNSAMLCETHHSKSDAHNVSDAQYQSKLLKATLKHILTTDYKLTQKDLEFYLVNKHIYLLKD